MEKNKKELVEIWGDVVELKSLALAILISGASTMGAYFIAPNSDSTKQLFFGLAGAVIGFVISTFIITPKRIITVEDERDTH